MKKFMIIVLVCFCSAVSLVSAESKSSAECVILLHGLGRTELSMAAIEWKLSSHGYTVVNSSYPSLEYSIEELSVLAVEKGVAQCRGKGATKINFVTHSLGGILLRHYLSENTIDTLGRVVMLGPPNQGSQLADYIKTISFTHKFQPLAGRQLGTDQHSIPKKLGAVNFELGVIAGNRNIRPIITHAIDGASDGTVLVEETKVAGMSDFLLVPATHSFMMWRRETLDQVVYFLGNGRFERSSKV
jgi:predicted alpha/beta hydrolase family esterase